jgi:hypothetical protein
LTNSVNGYETSALLRNNRGFVTLDSPATLAAMPHVILRYRLPDEQTEFTAAMQGRDAKSTIWEVDQYCRGVLKHGEPTEHVRFHIEHIRNLLRERPGLLDD